MNYKIDANGKAKIIVNGIDIPTINAAFLITPSEDQETLEVAPFCYIGQRPAPANLNNKKLILPNNPETAAEDLEVDCINQIVNALEADGYIITPI